MKITKWGALLGIAAILAPVPAAVASGSAPRAVAGNDPRLASARPSPTPASARPAPAGTVAEMTGESPCTPAEKMAESIAEYYASGTLRLR